MKTTPIISQPERDADLRYLLAKKGNNNLLIVGLNPGTDDAEAPDATTGNMIRIAENNGYDGWLLVNLYPRRRSDPVDLELKENTEIFWYNLNLIKYLLDRDQFRIKDAWLAWGDGIDVMNRPYLKHAAGYLFKKLLVHDLNYYSIGRTGKANPIEPNSRSINSRSGGISEVELLKFDYKHYVRNIRLEPEIKVNEIKFD